MFLSSVFLFESYFLIGSRVLMHIKKRLRKCLGFYFNGSKWS